MRNLLLLLLALIVVPAWAAEPATPAASSGEASASAVQAAPTQKAKKETTKKKKAKKKKAKLTPEASACPTGCTQTICGGVTGCFRRGCLAC